MSAIVYFVDPQYGDDSNDGLTAATPVRRWQLLPLTDYNDITFNLMSSANIGNTSAGAFCKNLNMYLNSTQLVTFQSLDPLNKVTLTGGSTSSLATIGVGGMTIFNDIIFVQNYSSGIIGGNEGGNVVVMCNRCQFIRFDGNVITVATVNAGCNFFFQNCIFDHINYTAINPILMFNYNYAFSQAASFYNCDFINISSGLYIYFYSSTGTYNSSRVSTSTIANCAVKNSDGAAGVRLAVSNELSDKLVTVNSFVDKNLGVQTSQPIIDVVGIEAVDVGVKPITDYNNDTYDGYEWITGAIRGIAIPPPPLLGELREWFRTWWSWQ